MIDYRYHLTSLAAVFLALAAGVVLGAGPLQATVSDALSGEVASVREQNANLTNELHAAEEDRLHAQEYLTQLGAQINAGSLQDYSVAVIVFPGIDSADVAKTEKALEFAGATVSKVNLTERFVAPGFAEYRSSLAPQLSNYLSAAPDASASAEEILASAVFDTLSDSATNATLRSILTNHDNPLLTIPEGEMRANSFVILSPPKPSVATPEDGADEPESGPATSINYADLVQVFASAPKSAVVLGDASSEDDPLALIRSQGGAITTIDSFPDQRSLLSLPQALRTANTQARAFGVQQGASLLVPSFSITSKSN